jgi:hypothetical protein
VALSYLGLPIDRLGGVGWEELFPYFLGFAKIRAGSGKEKREKAAYLTES